MTLLKKYWPFLLVLFFVCSAYQHCLNNKQAEYLGELAKNKEMQKNLAKKNALLDGYRKKNTQLTQDLNNALGDVKKNGTLALNFAEQSEKNRMEALKNKDYKSQAEYLNLQLIASNDFILKLNNQHILDIDNINSKWQAIVDNLNNEIVDLNRLYGDLNLKYGETVKSLVKCRYRASKRLILGPFIGIGVDGKPTVGIGVTFSIVKLPFKLF